MILEGTVPYCSTAPAHSQPRDP